MEGRSRLLSGPGSVAPGGVAPSAAAASCVRAAAGAGSRGGCRAAVRPLARRVRGGERHAAALSAPPRRDGPSDFVTCKTLMPGGVPLLSFGLRMGAVTGLLGMSRGELPLFDPHHLHRATLQPNLPLQDKKPGRRSRPYHLDRTAVRQKPTDIKILSFALPFLACHFFLHWEFFWE